MCQGARLGVWHAGSPLWEPTTRPGPAVTAKVTLTAFEAFQVAANLLGRPDRSGFTGEEPEAEAEPQEGETKA